MTKTKALNDILKKTKYQIKMHIAVKEKVVA